MPTTPRGYQYPALTDQPNGPAEIQALAQALDTDVQGIANRVAAIEAAWVAFTPRLTRADTGATIASTGITARYRLVGKTVEYAGTITASASSAGGGASVDLPVTSRDRLLTAAGGIFGTSAPTQIGLIRMTADKARLVSLATYGGSFADIASGQAFDWSVVYEAA